jgi:hypothetical protein
VKLTAKSTLNLAPLLWILFSFFSLANKVLPMSKKYSLSPTVQIPSLAKSIQQEQERQLAEIKPQLILSKEDSGISAHRPVGDNAAFTDKIYMFPESYNALRRELHDYWPNLWSAVSWSMAHKAEEFVERMNDALETKVQFDGNKVEATCQHYLNILRALRGLSPIH